MEMVIFKKIYVYIKCPIDTLFTYLPLITDTYIVLVLIFQVYYLNGNIQRTTCLFSSPHIDITNIIFDKN
jgi:hypothetical protein